MSEPSEGDLALASDVLAGGDHAMWAAQGIVLILIGGVALLIRAVDWALR